MWSSGSFQAVPFKAFQGKTCFLFFFSIGEVAQSCPALCDPTDYSLPGFSIHGIFQSGLPFPSPGDLPNPGIKPGYPALQADALPFEPPGQPLI